MRLGKLDRLLPLLERSLRHEALDEAHCALLEGPGRLSRLVTLDPSVLRVVGLA